MTTPTPADQIASEINSLRSRLSLMQDTVRLKNTLVAVEDLQTVINNLPQRLTKLRAQGYVFEKGLETQANEFSSQWKYLYPSLMDQLNSQAFSLQGSLNSIESPNCSFRFSM